MRKLLCLSFVFLLITNLPLKTPVFLLVAKLKPVSTYSFYVLDDLEAANSNSYYVIDNAGLGNIVRCKAINSTKVKKTLNKIVGESVQFSGNLENAMSILSLYDAIIIKTEWIEGQIYNVYAKSKAFSSSIFLENELVNFQICYNNGTITIGSPIILGDY